MDYSRDRRAIQRRAGNLRVVNIGMAVLDAIIVPISELRHGEQIDTAMVEALEGLDW